MFFTPNNRPITTIYFLHIRHSLHFHSHAPQNSTGLPYPVSRTIPVAYTPHFASVSFHLQLSKRHRVHTFLSLLSADVYFVSVPSSQLELSISTMTQKLHHSPPSRRSNSYCPPPPRITCGTNGDGLKQAFGPGIWSRSRVREGADSASTALPRTITPISNDARARVLYPVIKNRPNLRISNKERRRGSWVESRKAGERRRERWSMLRW